jgi:DNA-directed RNA polymerase subunit N (RpoN/RPB10)
MIIPIRCFSCHDVISGKYLAYLEKVQKYRKESGKTDMEYLSGITTKTAEGKALDDLGVDRPCCRRHFLTHVDL